MSGPDSADKMTSSIAADIVRLLDTRPSPQSLRMAMRHLMKWRCHVLGQHILRRDGPTVRRGPFAGMIYDVGQSEGAMIPRLLGYYEKSLVPFIEKIISGNYQRVLDIGAAEGYYAVGLALRMPKAEIHAYEISAKARTLLTGLAQHNGVQDRIRLFGTCTHASFDICQDANSAIICDIEGAEDDLLDPARAPGLRQADILVETHPGMAPGVADRLKARFGDSHRITVIGRHCDSNDLPDWMEELDDADRQVALWEWRSSPTPWLWMERK